MRKSILVQVSDDYFSWRRGAGGQVEQAHDKLVVLYDRYGGLNPA